MTSSIDGLALRRIMGRDEWLVPRPFGPDGWQMESRDGTSSVIVSCADHDGHDWVHASIARLAMPTYDDLVTLHAAAWPRGGYAYQVFAPPDRHVNIHARALHLWGRRDGTNALPDFAPYGSI